MSLACTVTDNYSQMDVSGSREPFFNFKNGQKDIPFHMTVVSKHVDRLLVAIAYTTESDVEQS